MVRRSLATFAAGNHRLRGRRAAHLEHLKTMELYKYFKAEVGLKTLETGLIRFSPANAFNDPFEMKPNITGFAPSDELDDSIKEKTPDLIEDEYKKLPKYIRSSMSFEEYSRFATERIPAIHEGKTSAQYLYPFLRMALEERIEKIVGVLCLTDSDRNLTMWAHYADSHKGLVIGFDTSHAFFSSTDTGSGQPCHLKKVTYCDDRPKLTFSGLRAEDIFLTKGKDWSRENEWRMFAGLSVGKVEVTKEGEEIHLFAYPHALVTKIIVGCRASAEVFEEINRIKAATPDLSRAVVLRASPDRNKYGLNFEAIAPV